MTQSDLLVVDRDNAISETLDGEVVVIHLHSGAYYSADALGTELWNRLENGASVAGLSRELAQRFDADDGVIAEALDDFVSTLRREGLVKVADAAEAEDAPPPAHPPEDGDHVRQPFQAPVFEIYEDLRELLHADPIHDVMNAGWPHLKGDAD